MNCLISPALCLSFMCVGIASAQATETSTVDYSIIRSVGAICGSGLSGEMKAEVDTKIARIFQGPTASGSARLDLGQVQELLSLFSENQSKEIVYKTYVSCVTQTISSIVGVSQESDITPAIDNAIIPDPLIVVQSGQQFAMRAGESRALGNKSSIFTVTSIGQKSIRYAWSNIDGKNERTSLYQSEATTFDNCTLIPYLIDSTKDNEKVSFVLRCR